MSRWTHCLALAAAGLLTACQAEDAETDARSHFLERRAALRAEFGPCPRDSGSAVAALVAQSGCLRFAVPEDYAQPQGRRLALQVLRIPAIRVLPEPDPLVILVGGPGQAASEDGVALAQLFAEVRQDRDILLVDQRGTGRLSPFDCRFGADEEEPFEADLPFLLERQAELLGECLAGLEARPEFYNTDLAVRDLEALREYLGYSAFNLWGGSYGSRVALAYLQAYPESLRRVVLDGAAPLALRLPLHLAEDGSAALQRVFDLCAGQPGCARAFPDLEDHFRALLRRLETPEALSWRDPATGASQELALSRELLAPLLRLALYSRETIRLLPLMIERAWAGDYRLLMTLGGQSESINQGMFLSVICSEDRPRISQADIDAELAQERLLSSALLLRPMLEACATWPARALPAAYFEPVSAEHPVLIFSGELDPVTPPRWAEHVRRTLPNARHLVAEGVGHIVSPYGCAPRLVAEFLSTAAPAALDASCLQALGPRPFFVNANGAEALHD